MSVATYTKDPDATLDYTLDWSEWLGEGETISTSDWTIPTGLTSPSDTNTTTTTTVRLEGGTAGTDYEVTNHVITSAGEEDDRTITIEVRER